MHLAFKISISSKGLALLVLLVSVVLVSVSA